jgi:hypothetical protein
MVIVSDRMPVKRKRFWSRRSIAVVGIGIDNKDASVVETTLG